MFLEWNRDVLGGNCDCECEGGQRQLAFLLCHILFTILNLILVSFFFILWKEIFWC